jgi:vancomycin permeability regulator SanA
MTMQSRSTRYYWRQRNRRLLRLINALLAAMLLLAVLLPSGASAQTWDRCWRIPHGQVCVARAAKITRITCDWGWQPQFGRVPRCIALGVRP